MRAIAGSRIPGFSSAVCLYLITMASLAIVGCGEVEQSPDNSKLLERAIAGSGPFCLATEFQPTGAQDESLPTILTRELARQAILIAARDGLGLATCDETLGEAFREDASMRRGPYELTVRRDDAGNVSVDLLSPEVIADRAPLRLFQADFPCEKDAYNIYLSQAQAMGDAARGKFVEQLRAAGFEGQPVKSQPEGAVAPEVESLLQKMDFVAQYDAVRRLHAAIADDGESPARVGGLVRGYANLAALTRHHWSSSNAAFTARSLLYAERMLQLSDNSTLAHRHRAYARALAGLPAAALEDLTYSADEPPGSEPPPLPAWVAVLEPYCNFEREELLFKGATSDNRPLANLLAFELNASIADERWNIAAGAAALKACPDAYCIYSELANHTPMLVQRQSVAAVAESIGRRIPIAVARIDGLPDPVREQISAQTRPGDSWLGRLMSGDTSSKAWSPLPHQIADGLRQHCKQAGDTGEPSWDVLATLIDDEQFVAAADYLYVAMNAVESSKQQLVDRLIPLIHGRPYLPYVASYAVDRGRRSAESAKFASEIVGRDPRPCMQQMMTRFWDESDANGQTYCNLYNHGIWKADRTFPAMVASYNVITDWWWKDSAVVDQFRSQVADYQAVMPRAPQTLRLEILTTEKPDDEQLADWEQRAVGDPQALVKLGNLYNVREEYAAAVRCFEKSYDLSPDYDTAISLADALRAAGQEEKWLPALESYLQEEDYSLGHALIHQKIANDYISKNEWSKAKPHAIEAAQTWSGWGLVLASRVCEGLGEWDESERWVREAVEGYPTYSGQEWYYWCMRNGRGDVAAARKSYEEFLQLDWVQNRQGDEDHPLVDLILTGKTQQALDDLQSRSGVADDIYLQSHALLLAKRAGHDSLYAELTEKLVAQINEQSRESDPNLCALYALIGRLAKDGSLSPKDLAKADRLFEKYGPNSRTNYGYFLAEQLALHGDMEHAEKYWRMSLNAAQFQKYNATLSGHRLAELHGTARTVAFAEPADNGKSDAESGPDDKSEAENSL